MRWTWLRQRSYKAKYKYCKCFKGALQIKCCIVGDWGTFKSESENTAAAAAAVAAVVEKAQNTTRAYISHDATNCIFLLVNFTSPLVTSVNTVCVFCLFVYL